MKEKGGSAASFLITFQTSDDVIGNAFNVLTPAVSML